MCLKLNSNSSETAKSIRALGSSNPFVIKGYKSLIDNGDGTYKSAYHNHYWEIDEKSHSNRRTVQLSAKELNSNRIDKGFHFYTDYQTALNNLMDDRVLAEFDIEVKDVVAFGKNSLVGSHNVVAVAATLRRVFDS